MAKNTVNQRPRQPGRKPLLTAEHTSVLRAITREQPRASLDEVRRELFRRTGTKVNPVTVRKALRAAGIERLQPLRRAGERAAVQGSAPMRVGYTEAHRRSDGASGMNTDLTDAQWALVADLFEREGKRGAPPRFERRTMVNACCHVLRTGCAWRLLPKSFPPWQAVYMSFKRWGSSGVFEVLHDRLRQQWRERIGKAPEPTAAIIAAQSTRSTAQGGNTGFDAGKKVKGRKRHLVVDTMGVLLALTITAANVQDRDAAADVVAKGFVAQAKRRVVERTHAWNERSRRLIAHHDRSDWAALAWVWLAETRILAARLAV